MNPTQALKAACFSILVACGAIALNSAAAQH